MPDQMNLFEGREETSREIDLSAYDRYVVAFSGGKDSTACVLHLLEEGVNREDIELWHHDVDGREGGRLMDWPVTPDYCQTIADGLEIELLFSWKVEGFEGEMLRENEHTNPIRYERKETGEIRTLGGGNGSANTRRLFPQVSADLSVRWCSSYLKSDVASYILRNEPRFEQGRTLFITGERAEESANRARYERIEPHDADLRDGTRTTRYIDHGRPILDWSEEAVWEILKRWAINPHPAYRLGWGRCSCLFCIFGNADQFASAAAVDPEGAEQIAEYEEEFGATIKRERSVPDLVEEGTPYDMDPADMEAAMSETFDEPAMVEDWTLPDGAFGDTAGPV
jgi:3'-phosphoadenosine 5'-phosphosulfate sulfotransferase (PAPS reductase)/FAD synthetase